RPSPEMTGSADIPASTGGPRQMLPSGAASHRREDVIASDEDLAPGSAAVLGRADRRALIRRRMDVRAAEARAVGVRGPAVQRIGPGGQLGERSGRGRPAARSDERDDADRTDELHADTAARV